MLKTLLPKTEFNQYSRNPLLLITLSTPARSVTYGISLQDRRNAKHIPHSLVVGGRAESAKVA